MAVPSLRQQLDRRMSSLRSDRETYQSHWRELSAYIMPRRGKFLVTANDGKRGAPINRNIINDVGTTAARDLAAGMMSGITSPSRPWFRLTTADKAQEDATDVRGWLDHVQKRMMDVFSKSNFYTSLAIVYEELGVFGTGVNIILEDREDVIRCYPLTVGEYFLGCDDTGRVNTLYREFMMTVAQLVGKFGLEQCSQSVQSLYNSGSFDQETKVIHAIEPNDKKVVGAPGVDGAPFRSVYYEYGSQNSQLLESKGFHEFPAMAPRWHLAGNEVYGRSPGMDALGSIKSLQRLELKYAVALDKVVDPPMIGDAALRNEPASVLPGGVTWVNGLAQQQNPAFRPVYQLSPNFEAIQGKIADRERRIQKVFYNDLFRMISDLDTVRTATEVVERKEEKLVMLGPVLERFHEEGLNRAIVRTFNIMMRMRLFDDPPDAVHGQGLRIEYVSMLAQAQKAVATGGIEKVAGFVGNIAAVNPRIIEKIDWNETVDEYAVLLGVPTKMLVPTDVVKERQANQDKQQQQQIALQNSVAAAQGAKTLSETDVGGGQNALAGALGRAA